MRSLNILAVALVVACGVVSMVRGDDDKNLPPLNAQVVALAAEQKGKQVGNGECWTLTDQVLSSAGAHRPGRDGYAAYEFGRLLTADEPVLPGDIVQFTDAKFVHTTNKSQNTTIMALHTGIVSKVDGTKYEMWNQNVNGVKTVMITKFDKADLKQGKMQFYRPQPAK